MKKLTCCALMLFVAATAQAATVATKALEVDPSVNLTTDVREAVDTEVTYVKVNAEVNVYFEVEGADVDEDVALVPAVDAVKVQDVVLSVNEVEMPVRAGTVASDRVVV